MSAKLRYPSQARIAQSIAGVQRAGFRPTGVVTHPDGSITVKIGDAPDGAEQEAAENPWDQAVEQDTD